MEVQLETWDPLIGDQGVGTPCKHALGEGVHNRGGLEMQVTQHLIRAPASEQADDIRVNIGNEECIGTGCSEASGSNVRWEETK